MLRRALCFAIVVLWISGCGKKEEPIVIKVEAPAAYKDQVLHFEVQYPKNWPKSVEPGKRVIFYSSNEAAFRFAPPFAEGVKGAKIEVGAIRGGAPEMEKQVAEFKGEFTFAKFEPDAPATIGGGQGTKLSYTIDAGDAVMHATRTYAVSDSFVTYIELAWFDESSAGAKPAFDNATSTLVIAHGQTAEQAQAASQEASSTLEKFTNEYLTFDYPGNFSVHNSKAQGMLSTVLFRGERVDCGIQLDVFDAKKLTVEKVFDQNKTKYPNAGSNGKTQIDGADAVYLNYSPMSNVASRVYFVVKGEKVYRIIINWYKPQQQSFLPVFEKCVESLKVK